MIGSRIKLRLIVILGFLGALILPIQPASAQEAGWHTPAPARLQLGISTTTADDLITYALYPKVERQERLWDLKINVPLPEGVPLVSVEAPPSFSTHFDGREVSFFTLELIGQTEVEPLIFRVSTAGIADPLIITHAWASWKNTGSEVGATIPTEEQVTSDAIVIQPNVPQRVVFDVAGDVSRSGYDLISVAFQESESTFTVIFNTAGEIGPAGQPVQYTLYIDSDCNSETGERRNYRGAEYRINYNHEAGRATLTAWDESAQDWRWDQATKLDSLIQTKVVAMAMPYYLIGEGRQFCWIARAVDETTGADLPADWLPNEEFLNLTRHEIPPVPTSSISGRLAVPLNNHSGFYDVSIFGLPGGQKMAAIANARQPHFSADGQRLLINHESVAAENTYEQNLAGGRTAVYVLQNHNPAENIFEYNLLDGTEKQVSDGSQDAYPYYNPQGSRVVYSNAALVNGTNDSPSSFLFAQCSLLPPRQETDLPCREPAKFGQLEVGELWGNYPVWTGNDLIAYQGCTSGRAPTACGIFLINAQSSQNAGQAVTPLQLTHDASDIPSDTRADFLVFTSQRDGNWEVYLINLDGTGLRNLSNNPDANDGLPAISPDGQWIAFVSDRQGSWAVWAVPIMGSYAQKLFDLPTDTPWGNGDRAWTNERISWGP